MPESEPEARWCSCNFNTTRFFLITGMAVVLILVTLVGNTLVACAVFTVRKLRQPSNYLLVSLAVADFCVALLVMPFASVHEVCELWIFGRVACHMWTSADVLLCSASILNLCAISVDRYWAITKPLSYGPRRTTRRMIMYILVAWLGALVISLVPIFAFLSPQQACACQVNPSLAYQLYATMGAFYIPVVIMIILNVKIYFAARRLLAKDRGRHNHINYEATDSASPRDLQTGDRAPLRANLHIKRKRRVALAVWLDRYLHCCERRRFRSTQQLLKRESKAVKTLSIIIGAFITCWLPFFVVAIAKPLCVESNKCSIPPWLDAVVTWLGYCNSTLNPLLYAAFNRDFRIPFREILCFRCKGLQNVLRSEIYAEIYGDGPPSTHPKPSPCPAVHRHSITVKKRVSVCIGGVNHCNDVNGNELDQAL